jgi:hypothetical protein
MRILAYLLTVALAFGAVFVIAPFGMPADKMNETTLK